MKFRLLIFSCIAALLFVVGCSNDGDNSDTGRLIVQLTDAPFPYDLIAEANVTVYKIEARYKSDDKDDMMQDSEMEGESMSENEGSGRPFITLMEEEIDVNLLELTNGITETLADVEVPVGTYDLVRVYVKGVNLVLNDETVYELKVPSGAQSGIKVFIDPPIAVEGGFTGELLLDIDVSRSFIKRGNSGSFNFKPVIKASNLATSGSISGTVTTLQEATPISLEGATVSLISADMVSTTTLTDASGMYMFMGVEGGTYDVMVELEGYESQTIEGVNVVPSNKTTVDFELEPNP